MLSGASPVFSSLIATVFAEAAVPAATAGKNAGMAWTVPTDGGVDALQVREGDVGIGDRAAVLLLVVVLHAVLGGREDRAEVELARAGRARLAGAAVGRRRLARDVDAVLDVEHADARRELVDQRGAGVAGHVVVRVRGPEDVELDEDVARIGALDDDLPGRLQDAVVDVLAVELLRVVVDVDGSDALLDRVLAERVEVLGGAERVLVGPDARAAEVAGAQRVSAEDLGRRDAVTEPLVDSRPEVAVLAGGVQAVPVQQRAVGLIPRHVVRRREGRRDRTSRCS